MNTVTRSILALAVVATMGWMGSTLMSSPSVAALDNASDAALVASNGDSASAVTTLVAENTVGATIFSSPRGSLFLGGIKSPGFRKTAGAFSARSTGVEVLALSSHAGGWWFRHSCFVP